MKAFSENTPRLVHFRRKLIQIVVFDNRFTIRVGCINFVERLTRFSGNDSTERIMYITQLKDERISGSQ